MNVRDVRPRDSIRSVDEPRFEPEHAGDPTDEVVVVDADPPRAYPIRILHHHEVVNDDLDRDGTRRDRGAARYTTVDSVSEGPEPGPIAVTWCPICWSAAVYDRRVGGDVVTFGVSGSLADDALVLYDRQTGSEWRQTAGDAISGPLEGSQLDALPFSIQTAAQFHEAHPDGLVLQPVRGPDDAADGGEPTDPADALASAYPIAPYEAYAERDAFGLHGLRGQGEPRSWDRDDVDAKTDVLGLERDGDAVGVPEPAVRDAGGVVTASAGDIDAVVVACDAGLHAFEDPGFALELRDDGALVGDGGASDAVLVGDGATWAPATGQSDDGRRLARVPARQLFAFAWQDVHGADAFYGVE